MGVSNADAATEIIGSPLTSNFTATAMGGGGDVTWAQDALAFPGVPGTTTQARSDGTIISWKARLQGGPFTLRIIRPTGSGYVGVGTSAAYTPASFAASAAIPTSLPIRNGEMIGIQTTTGNGYDAVGLADLGAGAFGRAWMPHLSDSVPQEGTPFAGSFEIALQATMRYCAIPDVRGIKLATARANLAAAYCTVGTIKRLKSRHGRKKAKFVRAISPRVGTRVSDTAPIDLTIGKKPKKRKN
jgi:hypothetical protein